MESPLKPIRLGLSEKLRNWDYFRKFFDERTRDEVATQLRELRKLREMSQKQFAEASGMHQSAVSRIEQADYSGWTYTTLMRAAETLQARLKIELIPAERVIAEYKALEEARLSEEFIQTVTAQAALTEEDEASDFEPDAEGFALFADGAHFISQTEPSQSRITVSAGE